MKNPKISVIMPIYNVEEYLEDTLENMVNQTFIEDIEVLMIDDGSTDNSRYIVEKYALDYDNFYAFHKKNEGQCVARNFALLFARGEYIHFMDSDDFITCDAYEKLYKYAKNGNYDVVTFNYLRFDEVRSWKVASQLDVFDVTSGDIENTSLFDFKELSWDMTNCNKLVKKELLDKHDIKYHYKNIIYEDNLFWIEIYINAKRMAVLKEYMYFWRYRENLTSTTQKRDMELAKRFQEMVVLVDEFINQNIDDEDVLDKKYAKLLTINLYFLMLDISKYPKENQEYLYDTVFEMVNGIPIKYFENLSSYFKVIYDMVRNKQWVKLSKFLSYDFKRNPVLPEYFNDYADKIDFQKDSHLERLNSSAKDVFIENEYLIIDFINFVPYNSKENIDEISFKILNIDFDDVILDSNYIKDNKLHIPLTLLNYGDNKIFTHYVYDGGIVKESYMNIAFNKSFSLNDFNIDIKRGTADHLRIFKIERGDAELTIDHVEFNQEKLKFFGSYTKRLSNININDYLGIVEFNYPIQYLSNNKFAFEIDFADFLKAPIRIWEVCSDDKFNFINLSKEYEFITDNYIISLKNHNNLLIIEFKLYNALGRINQLIQENKELVNMNDVLNQFNVKLNKLLSETYTTRQELWSDVANSKSVSEYDVFNEKDGELYVVDDYKELKILNRSPTVVRIFSSILTGDFEVTLEVKVSDYANIGISSSEDITRFTFLRISNKNWLFYRLIRIDCSIMAYVSEDAINWKNINLTGDNLIDDECQFQFNCGYSGEFDKRTMVKNIRIYSI